MEECTFADESMHASSVLADNCMWRSSTSIQERFSSVCSMEKEITLPSNDCKKMQSEAKHLKTESSDDSAKGSHKFGGQGLDSQGS